MQTMRSIDRLPLEQLFRDGERLDAKRGRALVHDDIRELLRGGALEFVVANVGSPLRWISCDECFDFWKREAGRRIADPRGFSLNDFPDGMAYVASEWLGDQLPIVLLEAHH
jgi:hypothetical protein